MKDMSRVSAPPLDERTVAVVLGAITVRAEAYRRDARDAEADGDEQAAYDALIQSNALLELHRDLSKELRCAESAPESSLSTATLAQAELLAIVQTALRVDDDAAIDAAIDIVIGQVDDALLAGRFDDVDYVLREAWPEAYGVCQALGLLTATFAARTRLPSRQAFYRRIEARLKEWRPDECAELLAGLQ